MEDKKEWRFLGFSEIPQEGFIGCVKSLEGKISWVKSGSFMNKDTGEYRFFAQKEVKQHGVDTILKYLNEEDY